MATLTPAALTLAEQMKQIGPGGNLLEVVNVLALYNEIDIDATYIMANDRFTDVSSKVISLPSIGNRRINRGAAGGVGKTEQHREFIEIMEARPYIDRLLLDSEPDGGVQARLNQIGLFVEAMAQAKATHLMYGNHTTDGEVINGFLTRTSDSSQSNVTKMGGSGSTTTSLLLVEWDPKRCSLIYPKAVPNGDAVNKMVYQALGVSEYDNGHQVITDDDGNRFDALESVIRVAFGIKLLDDRNIFRLANIESAGASNTLFDTGKINELVKAINKLTSKGRNAVIYCNADVKSQFDIYALEHLLGCTVSKDAFGQPVTMFRNNPIRLVEAITSTETALA